MFPDPSLEADTDTDTDADVGSVVVLPADPTGPALAPVVRALRSATRSGAVVVDLTATRHTSPGLRRVLAVLHREADRRGSTWTVRGELPSV